MTDSKMDHVKDDRKLKSKTNFISWKREFECAAKVSDILKYLTGEEVVPPKPRNEDYFAKLIEVDIRRFIRVKKTAQTATLSTEDDDETDDVYTTISTNNTLRQQIDYNEHKNVKEKMKLISKLFDTWVSDSIQIEIEDYSDVKEAYDFIKKRYTVTNECTCDNLLNQLNKFKLDDCSSMIEYTNRVYQIKADFKTVKYDMTDDIFATILFYSFPLNFRDFKEKYDQICSIKSDDSLDLDYLYERFYVEEIK